MRSGVNNMIAKYSYAEAYTNFLVYCISKENKSIDSLVKYYADNGIEERFKSLYEQQPELGSHEYYKILRSR